jgi:hypothetical protein
VTTDPPASTPAAKAADQSAGSDLRSESSVAVLRFVAAHRFVLLTHVRQLLNTGDRYAARQLEDLISQRLVRRNQVWHRQPPLYQITGAGLDAISSQLDVPRFDTIRDYRHDAGVPWITLAAQQGVYGDNELIITEREMRAADRALSTAGSAHDAAFGIRIQTGSQPGSARIHYPDLLLAVRGGQVAINLQTAMPGTRHLEATIAGYKADPHVGAALYLIDDLRIAPVIERAAAKLGMADPIHVQRAGLDRDPLAALAQ